MSDVEFQIYVGLQWWSLLVSAVAWIVLRRFVPERDRGRSSE